MRKTVFFLFFCIFFSFFLYDSKKSFGGKLVITEIDRFRYICYSYNSLYVVFFPEEKHGENNQKMLENDKPSKIE